MRTTRFDSLEALRQAALSCQACGLSERRRNVVFGEGDPSSPLVLVGEGPGDEEDKTGRPFVGRAGQLLERALGDAGLSRETVYICNTVKCRACDWETGKPVNRPPTQVETETCRQWLFPQRGIELYAEKPPVFMWLQAASYVAVHSWKVAFLLPSLLAALLTLRAGG